MLIAAIFVFSVFGAQLLRVQALDASKVQAAALGKRLTTVTTPALRGRVLDTNGVVLASSLERKTVTVDQTALPFYKKTVGKKLTTVGVVGAAQDLAKFLGTTPEALVPQLTGTLRYRIVAKNVTPLVWRDIQALGIPGVLSETTASRVYPANLSAAPLVGFVQADGTAGGGLEVMQDASLKGAPGKEVYQQAQDGTMIPWAQQEDVPATNGKDVNLTIDADLQWFAQNAIANTVISSEALSGYVVVMEARTGKLRAVASYPTFDPNSPGQAAGSRENHAFQDVYEPGSTGKVMSMSAAIEEKVVQPTTSLIVPNRLPRAGTSFKDDVDHPTLNLTVAGALAMSSNIGTMLATEKVAPAKMESYFRKFGIGEPTGVGFPGESPGLFVKAGDWSGSQRYTTLFGQGYSLNAIQAAGVYQTIANDGVRIPPSLVESTTDQNGTVVAAARPQGQRVVSKDTAGKVTSMLEEVVGPHGTAPKAKIDGYRVAGKTGTADRYDAAAGGYSGFTASFIGYAPADDPQFVVAVTLQRPVKGHFGGTLGAPIFKDVMTYALQKYEIPPTNTVAPLVPLRSDGAAWDPNDPAVLNGEKRNG